MRTVHSSHSRLQYEDSTQSSQSRYAVPPCTLPFVKCKQAFATQMRISHLINQRRNGRFVISRPKHPHPNLTIDGSAAPGREGSMRCFYRTFPTLLFLLLLRNAPVAYTGNFSLARRKCRCSLELCFRRHDPALQRVRGKAHQAHMAHTSYRAETNPVIS